MKLTHELTFNRESNIIDGAFFLVYKCDHCGLEFKEHEAAHRFVCPARLEEILRFGGWIEPKEEPICPSCVNDNNLSEDKSYCNLCDVP